MKIQRVKTYSSGTAWRNNPQHMTTSVRQRLQDLDPFVLVRADIKSRGTSLGGCFRLAMLPLLLAYAVVVLVQYGLTPDVISTTVVPASSVTDSFLQV